MKKRWMLRLGVSLLVLSMTGCGKKETKTTEMLTTVEMTEEMQIELTTEKQATTEMDSTESRTEEQTGENASAGMEAAYDSILREHCELLADFSFDTPVPDGMMGIYEMANILGVTDAARSTGYVFRDLNGDNVPELIVGYIDDQSTNKGKTVWEIYTYENNATKLLISGWTRNGYAILPDNRIANQGSGGAAYYCFGTYKLNEDNEVVCEEFYFSSDEESEYGDVYFYHSNGNDCNVKNAEKLDIEQDAFYAMSGDLMEGALDFEFIPFATYATEHNITIQQAN